MSENIKFKGYYGKIFWSDKYIGTVDVLRTNHFPTKQDVIDAFLENIFEVGYEVISSENASAPGEVPIDSVEMQAEYEAGGQDTVVFIDALKKWIKSEFSADVGENGPFDSCLEGIISESTAFVSRQQIEALLK